MTDIKRERTRLYLITPSSVPDVDAFVKTFEGALEGGDVACLQVRIIVGDVRGIARDQMKLLGTYGLKPATLQPAHLRQCQPQPIAARHL